MNTVQKAALADATTGERPDFSTLQGGQSRVLCTHCNDCGYNNFPPSGVCAHCLSLNVGPLALSPTGVLYSFTSMPSGEGTVFVGYVDLPENIRLFAELEGFGDNQRPVCGIEVGLQKIRYSAADARKPGPVFVFSTQGDQA